MKVAVMLPHLHHLVIEVSHTDCDFHYMWCLADNVYWHEEELLTTRPTEYLVGVVSEVPTLKKGTARIVVTGQPPPQMLGKKP